MLIYLYILNIYNVNEIKNIHEFSLIYFKFNPMFFQNYFYIIRQILY